MRRRLGAAQLVGCHCSWEQACLAPLKQTRPALHAGVSSRWSPRCIVCCCIHLPSCTPWQYPQTSVQVHAPLAVPAVTHDIQDRQLLVFGCLHARCASQPSSWRAFRQQLPPPAAAHQEQAQALGSSADASAHLRSDLPQSGPSLTASDPGLEGVDWGVSGGWGEVAGGSGPDVDQQQAAFDFSDLAASLETAAGTAPAQKPEAGPLPADSQQAAGAGTATVPSCRAELLQPLPCFHLGFDQEPASGAKPAHIADEHIQDLLAAYQAQVCHFLCLISCPSVHISLGALQLQDLLLHTYRRVTASRMLPAPQLSQRGCLLAHGVGRSMKATLQSPSSPSACSVPPSSAADIGQQSALLHCCHAACLYTISSNRSGHSLAVIRDQPLVKWFAQLPLPACSFGGPLLWPSEMRPEPGCCPQCGSPRVWEMQIMAPLMSLLLEAAQWLAEAGDSSTVEAANKAAASWAWCTLAVATCSSSCSNNSGWLQEHVAVALEQ